MDEKFCIARTKIGLLLLVDEFKNRDALGLRARACARRRPKTYLYLRIVVFVIERIFSSMEGLR